jgi:molybdopterin converting factor small subunit
MRVSVSFLGILRDQIGQKSLQVDLPDGSSFGDLMVAIAPLMNEKVGTWAWDGKNQRFSGRIVVSRQKAVGGTDAPAPLVDGEEILVFPPLAGG